MGSLLPHILGWISWFLCSPHILKGFHGFSAYLTSWRVLIISCSPNICKIFMVWTLLTSHPEGFSGFLLPHLGGFSEFSAYLTS
jgi:hypothetical protein